MSNGVEKLTFKIQGVAPLLPHNGQLADPMNYYTREIKKISGKRKKTDDDFNEMSRLEFLGSLYMGEGGKPVIPGDLIVAMIVNAAKASKLGKQSNAGLYCEEDSFPLIYDGPKDPEKLFKIPAFVDKRGVRVTSSRVMRTRPIFTSWALEFSVCLVPGVLNPEQVLEFLTYAGTYIGMCDYRPRFGRFAVIE